MAATPPPGALDAPAARRNAGPLLAVLLAELPADGTILEIGAGTGQHAAAFAQALLPRRWLPTEMDAERRDSIRAWMTLLAPDGARPLPPRALDAADPADTWPLGDAAPVSAMVSANVIHIAPWTVTLGILAGAARWLGPGAPLILYGPFHRDGRHMSPGNTAFDADLRSRDPGWGIRDLEREVLPVATGVGLRLGAVHEMPANNLCVVLRR
ncbi:MAG: DUF938 domain-containing protein [Thalassobaculaceae bacterium]|nr:DUF938 domain-containing protein [Thalassobaculaceae bacterium]